MAVFAAREALGVGEVLKGAPFCGRHCEFYLVGNKLLKEFSK